MNNYMDIPDITLGDQIELLKVLVDNFRDTGDFIFISEMLLLIDDIETPDLLSYADFLPSGGIA